MNIAAALSKAAEKLQSTGIAEPRREASSLLGFVLQENSAYLIAHSEDQLAANQKIIFDACVRRRANREPLQYITSRQEFWGLEFEVTPDVLIPRPETEILVEAAITFLSDIKNPRFCEAGVGSGCISISILHSLVHAAAVGTDMSRAALEVAARNARKYGVEHRFELREADLFSDVESTFDLIVTNPPYIPDGELERLQPEVRDFEPRAALAGGIDGLYLIRRIAADSRNLLSTGGVLLMEIGYDQADMVEPLFDNAVWVDVRFLHDLQRIRRVVAAKLK